MRVWWLEKLPARRASFVWEFIPIQTKTASSILLETVMFHYRGATQIDCFSPLCSHTIICAGRITGPDPAGTYCWFGASLESPFLKCSHTAIPPPAALCNVRDSEYSSFSSVSLCFLYCTSLQSKSQSPVLNFSNFLLQHSGKHPRRDFANGAGKLRLYIITVHTPPALFQTTGLRRTSPARCRL